MIQLIKNNQKYLEDKPILVKNRSKIENIAKKLNKNKLIILSGIRGVGKINIVNNLIQKSNYKNNYFYFNKKLDYNNEINSNESLNILFTNYTKRYNNPSIVVLENAHNIDGFKEFLASLYSKNKYKIIVIGNDIKISGKPNITVYPIRIKKLKNIAKENHNIDSIIKYGCLNDIILLKSNYLKKQYLELSKSDIIFNDIIKIYSLKNYNLYNYTIIFLSLFTDYTSLRKLNKSLNNNIKLSLVTMIEYIDYSIEAKLISKMYNYDIKKQKEITSKAKYYFTDTGIRNSLNGWNSDSKILKENFIYNELVKKGYKVNGGINGKFKFSFIAKQIREKNHPISNSIENRTNRINKLRIKNLHIHISKNTDKEEVKKELRKLIKIKFIPSLVEGFSITESIGKYLIVDNIAKINIKKLVYENVEIIEFEDFVEKVLILK